MRNTSSTVKSVFPTARPTSMRCGHSTSTGATARKSGPGKSPLLPMPDCPTASSVAISASFSVRPVDEAGSTVTKSTVPAIVVFKPSIGKRVMVRMPDSPAVSFAQLSSLPAPSDVRMPMPVTTTIGLPNLSRDAAMISPLIPRRRLLDRLDQCHAFASPMARPGDDNLGRRLGHFNLQSRRIVGRKQFSARDRKRRQREAQWKLCFQSVAEHRPRGAHRVTGMPAQKGFFLGGNRFDAGGAGDEATTVVEVAELRPKPLQRVRHLSGLLALRPIGNYVAQPRIRLCTARFCVRPGLNDKKGACGPQRKAAVLRSCPNRSEFVLQIIIAEFIEDEQVGPLAIVCRANQRDIALARSDASQRDPRSIDPGGFLSH